jgi:replication factor C large subunit
VGKTSAALALAEDFGWSVVEMNASDARNERAIDQVAGRASITHTLLEVPGGEGPRRALILLDEADSLSGRTSESTRPAPAPVSLREFLRGRYQLVEDLNAAWGLTPTGKSIPFGSWESLPRSPGNHAWARLASARRDIEEWRSAGKPRDTSDRGGLAAIARLVRSTRQPLVLTVNDDRVLTRYSPIFRTSVARVRFYPIRERDLADQLNAIARREGFDLVPGAVGAIAARARGDFRAALNDLDAISPLPRGPLQLALLGTRDLGSDFEGITEEVLCAARFYRSVEIRDRLDAPPDDLLPWIEENLPHFAPDPAHRGAAFERLASAEQLLARARRFRVWGLWSYASELLTGGVGLAIRDAPVPVSGRAQFPRFLGEMGRSRATRAVRESIVRKAGRRFHLSRDKSRDTILPFLEGLFYVHRVRRNATASDALARAIVRELELAPEEIGFLADAEPESPIVHALIGGPEERPAAARTEEEDASPETEPAPGSGTAGPSGDPERRQVQRQLSDFGGR